MTLADILKPSAVVLAHAQVRGVQLGAGAGALAAIPCLLLQPALLRDRDESAVATLANLAAVGAAVGMGAAAVSCAYKMSKLGKAGVADRAEALIEDKEVRKACVASGVGKAAGVAVAMARVWSAAKSDGKCVFGVAFRKETAWEVFAFGSLGIAVGAGVYHVGRVVCEKLDKGKVAEVCEVDEGEVVVDSGKESVEEELKKKTEE